MNLISIFHTPPPVGEECLLAWLTDDTFLYAVGHLAPDGRFHSSEAELTIPTHWAKIEELPEAEIVPAGVYNMSPVFDLNFWREDPAMRRSTPHRLDRLAFRIGLLERRIEYLQEPRSKGSIPELTEAGEWELRKLIEFKGRLEADRAILGGRAQLERAQLDRSPGRQGRTGKMPLPVDEDTLDREVRNILEYPGASDEEIAEIRKAINESPIPEDFVALPDKGRRSDRPAPVEGPVDPLAMEVKVTPEEKNKLREEMLEEEFVSELAGGLERLKTLGLQIVPSDGEEEEIAPAQYFALLMLKSEEPLESSIGALRFFKEARDAGTLHHHYRIIAFHRASTAARFLMFVTEDDWIKKADAPKREPGREVGTGDIILNLENVTEFHAIP